jgi:hypothetical protein
MSYEPCRIDGRLRGYRTPHNFAQVGAQPPNDMVISLTFVEPFLETGQRNRVLRAEREDRQAMAEVL